MEKELFLTVSNYSLPENAEKYLEALKNTPDTPRHYYNYALWLFPGFVYKLGRAKFPPTSAFKDLYKPGEVLFTEAELSSFEQRRKRLINVLDQIVSGKPLPDIEGIQMLLVTANQLTRDEIFKPGSGGIAKGEAALYPWTQKGERSIIKTEESGRVALDYDVLNPVLNLACYGLSAFLADEGRGRIKHCAQCNDFFLRARNDERNRFCSDDCRNLHNREQRKTDEGKAKRADYMKGVEFRDVLK